MESWAFQDIAVGERRELSVPVGPEVLDAFAAATGDVNPLHMDAGFARGKGFEGRVAHGLLIASYFSTLVGTMLPGRDCLLQSVRFDFKKPVLAGETLTFSVEVVQKVDAVRALVLEARAAGCDGVVRLSGRIQVGFTA
ncbi:MAG: MaoC family dehydratase N-terminal domain-containing protein [Elusimicrobia bacterium]|nr:MaoC family dehydratase N-terminal domain-containing protein [Elusimicrobiota bacterium]